MAICPSNCTTDIVGNPPEVCKPVIRQRSLSRLIMFPCNIELPDPITNENIKPFFDDGSIVFSSELAEIIPGAPTFEEIRVSDCRPPERRVATREITFRDLVAVTGNAGSPATETSFFDFYFWKDKVDSQNRLRYGWAYCNGDVVLAKNEDGSFMTADLTVFLDYIRPAAGGTNTEFKSGSIRFQGDPLNLNNEPSFNLIDAEIVI